MKTVERLLGRCLLAAPALLVAVSGVCCAVGATALRAPSSQAVVAAPDDFIWPLAAASPGTGGGSAREA